MDKEELALYVGEKIKQFRISRGMTQEMLAGLLNTTKQSIGRYENGTRKISQDMIFDLSDIFNCSVNDFFPSINDKNILNIYNQLNTNRQEKVYNFAEHQLNEQNNKVVPLLGATAANPTELSYGDTVYGESITTDVPKKADGALVVKGDSMEPLFVDGSIVFYRQQANVENGDLAIIEIDGDGVTFKKVYFNYDENIVILRSLNSKYEDREMKPDEIRVIGKVIK